MGIKWRKEEPCRKPEFLLGGKIGHRQISEKGTITALISVQMVPKWFHWRYQTVWETGVSFLWISKSLCETQTLVASVRVLFIVIRHPATSATDLFDFSLPLPGSLDKG